MSEADDILEAENLTESQLKALQEYGFAHFKFFDVFGRFPEHRDMKVLALAELQRRSRCH
jgi:hypothetical protein